MTPVKLAALCRNVALANHVLKQASLDDVPVNQPTPLAEAEKALKKKPKKPLFPGLKQAAELPPTMAPAQPMPLPPLSTIQPGMGAQGLGQGIANKAPGMKPAPNPGASQASTNAMSTGSNGSAP